jgi:hypothetical protein
MGFDRACAHVESLRDLAVAGPAGRERGDPFLRRREAFGDTRAPEPDATELVPRPPRPDRGAEWLEHRECLLEGLFRGGLALRAALERALLEQRAAELKWQALASVLGERKVERVDGSREVAACREEQALATLRDRDSGTRWRAAEDR